MGAVVAYSTAMTDSAPPEVSIREVRTPDEWRDAAALIGTYTSTLGTLHCVVDLAAELADLPGRYGQPAGGLLLAYVDGVAAGCCALRALPDADHTNACEMKRLYVQPAYRKLGLGHALVGAVMECARVVGYSCVLLDTLNEMEAARALYEEMGFFEVPPYTHSPIPGAHHLKVYL